MKGIVFSVLFMAMFALPRPNPSTNKPHWSDWSTPVAGLQIRGRYIGKTPRERGMVTVEIEIRNVSARNIVVFDFQDKPLLWPVSSSYLRGMLVGVTNRREPQEYHLLSKDIEKLIDLAPNESYSFYKTDIDSSWKNVQLVYDTQVVKKWWAGSYWKGRLETPVIYVRRK